MCPNGPLTIKGPESFVGVTVVLRVVQKARVAHHLKAILDFPGRYKHPDGYK